MTKYLDPLGNAVQGSSWKPLKGPAPCLRVQNTTIQGNEVSRSGIVLMVLG